MGSALDHLEKLLAEQYRRELDQDENIWHSLPFIAATLALELTTLFQVVVHLGDVPPNTGLAAPSWRGNTRRPRSATGSSTRCATDRDVSPAY